jgi:hypothetical protein
MLCSLARIIHWNAFLWHFSSSFEKSRFYAEVESLVARGTNYIDAVVDFCSRRGIEVETMTPNRSEPTGYKVVRVRFKDGRPDGSYKKFLAGFWISGQHRAGLWGRPAALAVMKMDR